MKNSGFYITIGVLIFSIINSFFVVDQRQQALIFQFGEVVRIIKDPGLNFKIPFIQNIIFFDKRILDFTAEPQEVLASDQKRVIVSSFTKYKISDPLKFYQSVHDEQGAKVRLSPLVESALRDVIARLPLSALLTEERMKMMDEIQNQVNKIVDSLGIEIVTVRIMRADLPKENSEAIYRRMQTDREKEAREYRAQGEEEANKIISRADKESKIIIAESMKNASILKGEGDSIASKIYANSYSKDPEFFEFYRSMEAYKKALKSGDTKLLLSPSGEFLKFFEKIN